MSLLTFYLDHHLTLYKALNLLPLHLDIKKSDIELVFDIAIS